MGNPWPLSMEMQLPRSLPRLVQPPQPSLTWDKSRTVRTEIFVPVVLPAVVDTLTEHRLGKPSNIAAGKIAKRDCGSMEMVRTGKSTSMTDQKVQDPRSISLQPRVLQEDFDRIVNVGTQTRRCYFPTSPRRAPPPLYTLRTSGRIEGERKATVSTTKKIAALHKK